jgi:hypothetical protein
MSNTGAFTVVGTNGSTLPTSALGLQANSSGQIVTQKNVTQTIFFAQPGVTTANTFCAKHTDPNCFNSGGTDGTTMQEFSSTTWAPGSGFWATWKAARITVQLAVTSPLTAEAFANGGIQLQWGSTAIFTNQAAYTPGASFSGYMTTLTFILTSENSSGTSVFTSGVGQLATSGVPFVNTLGLASLGTGSPSGGVSLWWQYAGTGATGNWISLISMAVEGMGLN